jgi:hypothetical protein
MNDNEDKLKTKEEWLREEIRAVRALSFTVIQWGVTVLTAVGTSLYYLRRDIADHLKPPSDMEAISYYRWCIGSGFLFFLASIFSRQTKYLNIKLVSYREQLIDMKPSYSGIFEKQPAKTWLSKLTHLLLYAFPILDQFLYLVFSHNTIFGIHF